MRTSRCGRQRKTRTVGLYADFKRAGADVVSLVQQFKSLRFKEFKGTVIDKDPPSDPMDKDRHLIDCVSYILLDDPRFIDQRGGLSTFEPIHPSLAY